MLDLLAPLLYTNEEGLDEDNRNYGIASIVDNLVSKVEADEYPLRVLPRLDEDFVWRTPSRSGIPRELPPLKPVKPRPGPPPPEVKQWLQSHLNLDETCLRDDPTGRSEIEALIMRHWDIFDYDGRNLPEMTGVFHEIQLIEGAQPVYCAPYRMSPDQKRALEDHVKDLLAQNVIEPSQSDWQSPVMFIGKKGGGWRVVQDFRKLNQLTQIPRYPLPLVAQVLDELSTSRVYSAFDARSGFWQVPLAPASRHLTAFGTHIGQFQWRRMPMGLSGSPPTYQRGMNRSYAAILYKCCILYLDDAILYSLLVSGHFEVLEVFFDLTRDADITLTARKMQLFRTSLKYVGMLISNDGVRMDDTKVKAILDMPVNSKSSMKAIRSFLGATNYFRKWLKDYSRVTAPLRRVLKKDAGGWDEECDKAVAQLKRLLTSDPLLVWPDFTKEFELHTDASDIGYGAILVQRDEEGRERVIAFGSRAVGESEKSWTAQEKECFAVIVFTEEFRPYLQDRPFKLVTDAANLKWLLTTEHTTQRLMRWAIRLSAYGIEIVHREGKLNAVADMLSRNVPASMASGCPNAGVTVGSIACERGTQNAENYLEALNDRNADIVMVSGPAGTGKSMLACQAAAKALRDGVVRQIVITRPVVPVGRDIGYIKGSVVDKMSMWIKPLLSYLCKFLSDERVRELQATGGIQVIPISMIRGFSFEDTWIIVDEAQNCSPSELWAVLTRLGTGSRMVVIGDMFQCDLQGKSGFEEVMSKVLALAGSEGARIRCVQLSHVDCRRSPVVKMLLKLKHGANGSDSCRGQHIEHKSSYLSYDSLDSHITEAVQEWIGHTGGIISVSKGSLGLSPETWEMRHVLRSILNSAGVVKMRALFDAVRVEREGLRFLQQHGVLDMDTAIVALDIGFTLSAGVDISSSSFLPGVAPELIEWVGPTVIDALEDAAQGYYSSRYLICGATSNEARDSAEAGVHHKPVREYRSEPAVGNTRRRVAYQDPCQKYGCTRTAMFSDEGLRLCKYCVDLCRNDFCRRPRASSSLYCTNCKRSFGEGEAVFEGLEAAMDVGGQEAEAESDGEVSNDIQRSLDALLISDLQRQNPSPETLRYVKKLQEEDPEIYPVIKYLNGDCAGLTKEAVMKVRAKAERHYLDQLLRRTQYDESLDIVLHQVVVPKALRASLLDFYHTGVENGHPGRYGMYNLLRKQFYWKGMWRDCSECVRRCLTCRSISRGPTAYGNVQQHSRYTSSAMKRVGVDLVGPIYLPEHVREKDVEYPLYCLTMLDVYTGWLELAPLYTKEAKEVAQSIVDNWILRHGPFAELLSDRGGEFLNDTMTHICRILRITHLVSSGHRPQTNGCTERINQELIRKLKIWAEEFEGEWWRALPVVQHALRIIPRRDCGFSPFELLYGRVPHTMLDQMLQDVLSQVQPDVDDYYIKLKRTLNKIRDRFASLRSFSQDRREEEWNEDAQVESFPIGSYVLYYRELGDLKGGSAKLIRRWHGPYVVVERRSAVNYLLADSLDPTCRWLDSFVAHTNCMLKCPEDLKPHFESKYTVPPPSDLWDLNVIPDSVKIGDILLVAGASGDRSMWHVGRVIERHPDNGRILLHLFAVPKESHFTTTRPGPFRPSYKHRLNGGLFVTKGKVNGRTFRMRVCDVTGNNIVRVNVLDSRDYLCASATADLELYGLADSPSSS
ncbi:retrovirus polyprotein, putative [Perkinsus marinus ATCC 50983]|uniref:Retrovirus polyprotein, putative n=1 Tax=Perkinsus marinus (strain ATCC 50983 / TXsc) TaxID=423536 RepID=C5LZ83_PERM5|nr:retrovirus polyprotein, putative [Perkinsus marinus ATCC 50983]EEQ97877.1 retrovirus polyprotein, putative [Perkinsus marinus ATCC 50983]|eukprot:XP_002765160.1 retrovirus polyprotein, putative [Perkinsus marinus ATCC 50983]